MKNEIIDKITVNEDNELVLKVVGRGDPIYQYIYREAAGVYWDEKQKAFKSTPLNERSVSEWILHIKDIVKSALNIELSINENIEWENITDEEKMKILKALQQRL